ncbi:MAG TPA: monovalent cation/H+ antiporter complex subunit F [Mycobacteriales bacterium]|nr:monovalent cation/H+ antiporter complex subunit F [Mycobacteriales bacterium]
MNAELVLAAVLVVGAGPPCLIGVCRRDAWNRLVALELLSAVSVLVLLLVAVGAGRSSYLVLPVTLAVLSTTGALVTARLLHRLD